MSEQLTSNLNRIESLKKEVRANLRAQLQSVSAVQRQQMSSDAARQLAATPEFVSARTIMIFLSLSDEIDTSAIALKAWQNSKTVVAPRMDWECNRMIPVEITSLQKNMFEVTQFNVLEPVGGDPVLLKDIDLILVPGLGFTNDGNRLGRGRGIYDRFLSQPDMRAITCGLAMELQVLETLPVLDHDAPLSMLVTNRNVRRFSRK